MSIVRNLFNETHYNEDVVVTVEAELRSVCDANAASFQEDGDRQQCVGCKAPISTLQLSCFCGPTCFGLHTNKTIRGLSFHKGLAFLFPLGSLVRGKLKCLDGMKLIVLFLYSNHFGPGDIIWDKLLNVFVFKNHSLFKLLKV